MSIMKKAPILIAAFILGSFAVGGVGLVAMTHELTDARIAENQREAMLSKLKAIIPEGRMSNDPLRDAIVVSDQDLLGAPSTEVYRVRDQGEPVALILKPIVPDGYAGPIKLLVSVLPDGSLGGVRVIEHHETPGLGDKIEERKDDWIIEQFNGRSLGEPPLEQWTVKRDGGAFDQFTGATITPRSVVKAVKDTLLFVERHGDALYERPAAGQEASPAADEAMQAAGAAQQAAAGAVAATARVAEAS
jgi:electron transport complex protein RnfG